MLNKRETVQYNSRVKIRAQQFHIPSRFPELLRKITFLKDLCFCSIVPQNFAIRSRSDRDTSEIQQNSAICPRFGRNIGERPQKRPKSWNFYDFSTENGHRGIQRSVRGGSFLLGSDPQTTNVYIRHFVPENGRAILQLSNALFFQRSSKFNRAFSAF